MDAVKYFKIKKRMTNGCAENSNCSQCALDSENNQHILDCIVFEMQHPEEAVEAVEKWAEEHPVKTRMSDFIEKFPKARVLKDGNNEYVDICPVTIDITWTCLNGVCKNCMQEYWNEEVEE